MIMMGIHSYADLSHLLRYGFVILFFLPSVKLFVDAFRNINARLKQSAEPVGGFFVRQGDPLTSELSDKYLPLYHTTVLGRSRKADIRVKGKGVASKTAYIFYHGGRWYIENLTPKPVFVNHQELRNVRELKNGDVIGIGFETYTFVKNEEVPLDIDQKENEMIDDILSQQKFTVGKSFFLWLCLILFQLLSLFSVYVGMESSATLKLRWYATGFLTICFLLVQILHLLSFTKTFNFERGILYIFSYILSLGAVIQIRLLYLSREFPSYLENYTEAMWFKSLRSATFAQLGMLCIVIILLPIIFLLVKNTNILEKSAIVCLFITPLFYLITLFFGRGSETHGSSLWISIGSFSLQLGEFCKITWLIVLAYFFKVRPQGRRLLFFAIWATFNAALVILLPDLGTLMILLPTTIIVFTVMTSHYFVSLLTLLGSGMVGILSYKALPYVQRRLYGWISLWDGINDQNRQIIYGLQAIGRGGFFGRGLGNGSPEGIPLANSDMIYTIVWEEFGGLVAIAVILLFMALWLRGVSAFVKARDGFTYSLAIALVTALLFEALVMIGGTTGLIPLTGVTLPFVAKGGTSIFAKTVMIAILLGLFARKEKLEVA